MKKVLLLLAVSAFATASFAQTPTKEVKVRDNGTKKVVTTTGKTNVGAALSNTADAAGKEAHKVGTKASHVFHKGAKKTKSASLRASNKLRKSTKEMDANTAQ